MADPLLRAFAAFLDGQPLRLPEGGELLWGAFKALHETRGIGFSGPAPISFVEIEAYGRTMQVPFQSHHVALIRTLDRVWLEHADKQAGAGPSKAGPATRSAQAVSPAAFDSVFGS